MLAQQRKSATVTGNATLKIEDEGEQQQEILQSSLIDLGMGYDDSTTATVNNIQQPDWSPEKGIYVNVPKQESAHVAVMEKQVMRLQKFREQELLFSFQR